MARIGIQKLPVQMHRAMENTSLLPFHGRKLSARWKKTGRHERKFAAPRKKAAA
jgi:hypothetical protein